jgi:hypothetical protein
MFCNRFLFRMDGEILGVELVKHRFGILSRREWRIFFRLVGFLKSALFADHAMRV